MSFQLFDDRQIASLRRGGAILRECLALVAKAVRPGITTGELDRMAEEFIRSHKGATPAFKGYNGFPATLCISVNDECVHGIPGPRVLEDGDLVSLDGGVILDELYTDAAVTVGVGRMNDEASHLLEVTNDCLREAVKAVRPGARIGDISAIIQEVAEAGGCTPARSLTGHGLGTNLHQFPDVPNVGVRGKGPALPAHTLIAIEPIITTGRGTIQTDDDGWTIRTTDRHLCAHAEHSVLVTEGGCEILA